MRSIIHLAVLSLLITACAAQPPSENAVRTDRDDSQIVLGLVNGFSEEMVNSFGSEDVDAILVRDQGDGRPDMIVFKEGTLHEAALVAAFFFWESATSSPQSAESEKSIAAMILADEADSGPTPDDAPANRPYITSLILDLKDQTPVDTDDFGMARLLEVDATQLRDEIYR